MWVTNSHRCWLFFVVALQLTPNVVSMVMCWWRYLLLWCNPNGFRPDIVSQSCWTNHPWKASRKKEIKRNSNKKWVSTSKRMRFSGDHNSNLLRNVRDCYKDFVLMLFRGARKVHHYFFKPEERHFQRSIAHYLTFCFCNCISEVGMILRVIDMSSCVAPVAHRKC